MDISLVISDSSIIFILYIPCDVFLISIPHQCLLGSDLIELEPITIVMTQFLLWPGLGFTCRSILQRFNRQAVEEAITQIMMGEEAEEMRSRAKKLGEMARKAVEEGGSSCSDFDALIE